MISLTQKTRSDKNISEEEETSKPLPNDVKGNKSFAKNATLHSARGLVLTV